jgi:hypothetical protein
VNLERQSCGNDHRLAYRLAGDPIIVCRGAAGDGNQQDMTRCLEDHNSFPGTAGLYYVVTATERQTEHVETFHYQRNVI